MYKMRLADSTVKWVWDHPAHLAPKLLGWPIGIRLTNDLRPNCGTGKINSQQKYVKFPRTAKKQQAEALTK